MQYLANPIGIVNREGRVMAKRERRRQRFTEGPVWLAQLVVSMLIVVISMSVGLTALAVLMVLMVLRGIVGLPGLALRAMRHSCKK